MEQFIIVRLNILICNSLKFFSSKIRLIFQDLHSRFIVLHKFCILGKQNIHSCLKFPLCNALIRKI